MFNAMNKPRISIIVPSYNQGKYIEETLLSIFNQRIDGLQLIVMDGGSTDETVDVLKKYSDKIDFWVSERDRGQTDAINKGLKHVKADIVGWLNSDDVYLRGALKKVLRVFDGNPDVGVVHGDRLMLSAESHVIGWVCGRVFNPAEYGYNVASETAFWRVKALPEELDASLRFAMDLDWFSRLYLAGAKFHMIPDFIGGFRCHAEAKSATLQDVCLEESERVWTAYFSNDNWKLGGLWDQRRFYSRLLTRPFMLTIPFLYQRFILRPLTERRKPVTS
jgi:glycosyltransferase involved in cell wall biosynthesis